MEAVSLRASCLPSISDDRRCPCFSYLAIRRKRGKMAPRKQLVCATAQRPRHQSGLLLLLRQLNSLRRLYIHNTDKLRAPK